MSRLERWAACRAIALATMSDALRALARGDVALAARLSEEAAEWSRAAARAGTAS